MKLFLAFIVKRNTSSFYMDFRRLFDIFPYQLARFPNKAALAHKEGMGWANYSTQECITAINEVSAGLIRLGLKKGDKMAILLRRGSPRWAFLDFGMQQIGVIPVPIHATCSEEELTFILNDCAALYCVAATRELFQKVQKVRAEALALKEVFTMEDLPGLPGWSQLTALPSSKHLETLQAMKAAIHEDDLATIIYTSGTTGEPKGVMLSHKNIVSNIKATITLIPVNYRMRAFSFLPPSHIFERMVTYTYLSVGASVYFAGEHDNLMELIREARPHYFTAVPRFLEKAYEQILDRTSRKPVFLQALVRWAIAVGEQYRTRGPIQPLYWLKLQMARATVFWAWRRQLGGRVQGLIVGAAALQERLARLFTAAGLPVREGYGLTETSPVVAFNRFEPGGTRFGTVGIPIPGLELRIEAADGEEEGEILVKGPNVMLGYYNKPEATAAVLTEDGWFRTGDVGKLVHKRFLQITGRKKDIFKTSSGKYVSPQEIENHFKASPYIEECMAIGFQRPFVVALLLPHFPMLERWCRENEIHWTAPQYMVHNHKLLQFLEEEIRRLNEPLAHHKRIRNFRLLHEEWTPESGELTPTLKLRREKLSEQFKKEVEAMYEEGVRW